MPSWCSDSECVRLLVALGTLGVVLVLLLAVVASGAEHAAMVTGLLASFSAVLAWYFGSQGVAAANQRAGRATSARLAIRASAKTMEEEIARLRRDLALAEKALEVAMQDRAARDKVYAMREEVDDDVA